MSIRRHVKIRAEVKEFDPAYEEYFYQRWLAKRQGRFLAYSACARVRGPLAYSAARNSYDESRLFKTTGHLEDLRLVHHQRLGR
jgi:hypothetical protein